jgi:protein-S-isoprenylcysteine O-methyltransferase Ste14
MEAAAMSRVVVFVYGLICYAISLGVFVYGMGFIVGFLTPTMLDGVPDRPLAAALGIDLGLLAMFALQHSGMARPAFKRRWTRIVPEAAERSTYLLVSSVALGALFVFWAPIGGIVWQVSAGIGRGALIGLYLFGWLLLLYTTFLIDHFDLFGLTQVWRHLTGKPYRPPQFHTPSLYKLVRHPLYIGWLTIFWAAPTMTVSHLVFAVTTTAYILLAIRFEERDLVSAFGERYAAYRERTPMLVPRLPTPDRADLVSENQARH